MEWLTRYEAETSQQYGSVPEKRSVEELMEKGIVIIDKPFGPQSNQVSTWVKKELNAQKTGHFGTLDPNATGVLPIGINSGTRANKALAEARKEYVFEAELSEKRDEQKVSQALSEFEGTNKQTPPEKSAVKREQREREVYDIELLEVKENKVLGRVSCESGFYVRILIEQLGQKLDTGAKMEELRRTKQAGIDEEEADTLQDVVDAYHFWKQDGLEEPIRDVLYPIEKAVRHLPKIAIKDSAVNAVANGADLGVHGISKLQSDIEKGNLVAITTLKGELVALAEAEMDSNGLLNEDGNAATLETVHMDPEEYPKRWKQ